MRYTLSFCCVIFIAFFAQAQLSNGFSISGTISGYEDSGLILNRLIGHKELKVSEAITGKDGTFNFQLTSGMPPGQYRIRPDKKDSRDMIVLMVAGESISVFTQAQHFADSALFSGSPINLAFHQYLDIKANFEGRLSILEHLLSIYPPDQRFYPQILSELNILQDEMAEEINAILRQFPNTILSAYIRSDQSPRLDSSLSAAEQQVYAVNNFLNNIDFSDTLLLNTDIFPNKSFAYIMFFRGAGLDRDQQADEFIRGLDQLLPHALIEPKVFNYILEYLISGFEQIGLEKVLEHIASHYEAQELCVSDQGSDELKRRIEGYKRLASGNLAPAITANDINGKELNMAKLNAERTLLFFYASWCPHCSVMLPKIKELALTMNASHKTGTKLPLVVIAVSIDTDIKTYLNYLEERQLGDKNMAKFWFNLCDYKGWDGGIPNDYYLYATPTMLLLNDQKIIIGKPSNPEEIQKLLNVR